MSTTNHSSMPRRSASLRAWARMSRVSVKMPISPISFGGSGVLIGSPDTVVLSLPNSIFVRPAPVPKCELHRPEAQMAEQLGDRGQHFGCGDVAVAAAEQRREGALLAVALGHVEFQRGCHDACDGLVADQRRLVVADRLLTGRPEVVR